jgi:hypothetical protein
MLGVVDQHGDRGVIEISVSTRVSLDADQLVDLAETDAPGHQRLTDLRKVATYSRSTNLGQSNWWRLVTRRPQI